MVYTKLTLLTDSSLYFMLLILHTFNNFQSAFSIDFIFNQLDQLFFGCR